MKTDTKHRILDTAERLFAEQGYAATSLRQIIAEANVNLAAVHYHFGPKEKVLDAVIQRKVGPVNEARMALFDRAEAEAGHGSPPVERVLRAFLSPMSEAADHNPQFVRMMGRIYADGLLPEIKQRHFGTVWARFVKAMHAALPDLSERELLWRMHFLQGAMAHTMCATPMLGNPPADFGSRIERLLVFLAAGFRAPAIKAAKGGER